jgi:hypothetical protein
VNTWRDLLWIRNDFAFPGAVPIALLLSRTVPLGVRLVVIPSYRGGLLDWHPSAGFDVALTSDLFTVDVQVNSNFLDWRAKL